MNPAPRCLSLVKGEHRWLFSYAEGCESELLGTFVALANDPDCEFDFLTRPCSRTRWGSSLPGSSRRSPKWTKRERFGRQVGVAPQ